MTRRNKVLALTMAAAVAMVVYTPANAQDYDTGEPGTAVAQVQEESFEEQDFLPDTAEENEGTGASDDGAAEDSGEGAAAAQGPAAEEAAVSDSGEDSADAREEVPGDAEVSTDNTAELIAAPAAEPVADGGAWQEDTETVHHDAEGHYEKETVLKEKTRPARDEEVERPFYKCTVCGFKSYNINSPEIDDHLSSEHPTGNGHHYYNIDGEEIYPSYGGGSEIVTIHHDAETYMEEVEEDVWHIDRPAWDEIIHSGVYRYYVDGKAVTGTLAAIDGETYLFDEEGVPMTGWRKVGDDLYYFGADGKMQTGWHTHDGKDLYTDPETGKAAFNTVLDVDGTPHYFNSEGTAFTEGVVEDNGREYYFDGVELAKDKWVVTGSGMCYFDADGAKVTGTVEKNGRVFPVGDDGTAKPLQWVDIADGRYYTDLTGAAVTGWQTIDGDRYHFESSGKMSTGAVEDGGAVYPVGEDGTVKASQWVEVDGKRYYTDENGAAVTGWQTIDDTACHFEPSGEMSTGIVLDEGKAYPVGEDGTLKASRWVTVDGKRYYTDENGAAVTGWHKIGGRKYYFTDERYRSFKEADRGRMMTGWASVGNRTYYFADSRYSAYDDSKAGIQLSGWKTIGGKRYYFMDAFYSDYKEQNRGILLTGFRKINGNVRYLTDDRAAGYKDWKRGIMLAGHATIGGKGYFFSPTGVMATNKFATKNGEKYYFSKNGVMVRQGFVTVNGRTFYLEKSGKMHKGFLQLNGKKYYFGWNGVLAKNRWLRHEGRWYWADNNGILR